jgi:L1 cell adhesion molecule like protein
MLALGIDLGTTYSCVGIWRNGTVDIIANEMGNKTTPSIVAFSDDDVYVGDAAKDSLPRNPQNTVYGAKRLIGRSIDDPDLKGDLANWLFKVQNDKSGRPKIYVTWKGKAAEFYPEEISSLVLKYLKKIADATCASAIKDAVITVPAYFNDAQRSCTKEAGRLAGLNLLRIINEPTAAAIAFGLKAEPGKQHMVLVFDLGGGTFDVSILRIEDGMLEVQATSGLTHLGGEDFDANLVQFVADKFNKKHGCEIRKSGRAMMLLKNACEKAKRVLSTAMATTICVDCLFEGKDLAEKVMRSDFEDMNMKLFELCIPIVRKALGGAGLLAGEITDLLLVGGSSRIPYIKTMLQKEFPKLNPYQGVNPDEAVAFGAAVQAHNLVAGDGEEDSPEGAIILCDICPYSFGIEVDGRKNHILIKANSIIPTTVSQDFTPTVDGQEVAQILIFQGDSVSNDDNEFLGQFELTGLPRNKRRKEVLVHIDYTVDADGILSVEARAPGVDLKSVVIDRKSSSFVAGKPNRNQTTIDFFDGIGNPDFLFMKGVARDLTANPETEPYFEGAFKGFQILIVCLYLGQEALIDRATFEKNCGTALKSKGFVYKLVCSYGEGIAELLRTEDGRCPYCQLWIIPSCGNHTLPPEATDKDVNKIIPFLRAANDFWMNGGGLFLYPDNTPCTFEVNYILRNILTFKHNGRTGRSGVRYTGKYIGKNHIRIGSSEGAAAGTFSPLAEFPSPGPSGHRISLRPGLISFYEGVTVSSPANDAGKFLSTADELWPFTAFAWTSEPVSPPRALVCYFDPKIEVDSDGPSPGPIVIHGGFTSAFIDFGDDLRGTGRLIISIACWLSRIEERTYESRRTGKARVTSTPKLTGTYLVTERFTGWSS